jgi:hypothetical protein
VPQVRVRSVDANLGLGSGVTVRRGVGFLVGGRPLGFDLHRSVLAQGLVTEAAPLNGVLDESASYRVTVQVALP